MRSAQRIVLIGYGAVAQAVLRNLAQHKRSVEVLGVLRRQKHPDPALRFFDSLEELLSLKPDLVVECAGQAAVVQYAERIAAAGVDLMTISMGAFADTALLENTRAAALKTGAQIIIPAGAVGALDVLAAVRHEGIERVTFRSTKLPKAWAGTAAEKAVDLSKVTVPVVFFTGNAKEAALAYPMNANVAAAVALAGAGFERTTIELVADPAVAGNLNEVVAEGPFGRFNISMLGKTRPEAPRTSISAPLSIVRGVMNRAAGVVV
ncbi:MAG: aspartate dehydrogenase [Betaproteobacteria bacterium]|nr:aspartate dehydrogenase [Betaproteobacteria bacterium]